ncbi:MAG: thiosulfate oxidation carrier protein SoxY [Magnetococcus sp. DMHC-8]
MTRRTFFRTAGVVGAAVATSGLMGVPFPSAQAEEAAAPAAAPAVDMDALIAKQVGAGAVAMEKITLDIPATAENAALVRMPVVVDHPMEANNFIQSVALFIDNNPSPFIAQFDLLPEAGKAALEFRARMAKTSKVRVIAKSNTGKLYGLVKEIQVAAGGCAG